jgi:hypothetical protein
MQGYSPRLRTEILVSHNDVGACKPTIKSYLISNSLFYIIDSSHDDVISPRLYNALCIDNFRSSGGGCMIILSEIMWHLARTEGNHHPRSPDHSTG